MAKIFRHTGKLTNTGQRCVVVFRKVPGEESHALVVQPDQLPDMYHDNLMDVLGEAPAQNTHDLSEVLHRRQFGDGSPMLRTLHERGYLKKVPVENVTLYPLPNHPLPLADANREIDGNPAPTQVKSTNNAQDVVEKTVIPVENVPPSNAQDPAAIAANLLAQAKLLEEDADRLKQQAYDIHPESKPKKGRPTLSEEEKERRKEEKNTRRREKYAKEKTQQSED